MVMLFNDCVIFGLGINVFYGIKIEYEDNWGNVNGGFSFVFFLIIGDLYVQMLDVQIININLVVGIQIIDNLCFGVGVNYQQIDVDIENFVICLEGDDDVFGWNVGLIYSLDDYNYFGVVYCFEISYDIDGDIIFKLVGVVVSLVGVGVFFVVISGVIVVLVGQYFGKISLDLFVVLQFFYVGDLIDWIQLLLGVECIDWSSLDCFVIEYDGIQIVLGGVVSLFNLVIEEFNWEDIICYFVGVCYILQNDIVLCFGLVKEEFIQSSDNCFVILLDFDCVWVIIGVGFKFVENFSIDVVYVYIFVDDVDIYKDSCGVVFDGIYELDVNVIGVQLNYQF